jgi:secreted trypsin-like serine protease
MLNVKIAFKSKLSTDIYMSSFLILVTMLTLSSTTFGIINGSSVTDADPISRVAVKVLILHANGQAGGCSGTVISGHSVLTAAHCSAGGNKLQAVEFSNGMSFPIRAVKIHPQFASGSNPLSFDFAVVDFNSPSSASKRALLSIERTDPTPNSSVAIAGFGITNAAAVDFGTLRKLSAIISNKDFSSSQIEVNAGPNAGSCHGDSGGPGYLVQGETVIVWGTDSTNSPRATSECLGFEVYGKVSAARQWILSQASE